MESLKFIENFSIADAGETIRKPRNLETDSGAFFVHKARVLL